MATNVWKCDLCGELFDKQIDADMCETLHPRPENIQLLDIVYQKGGKFIDRIRIATQAPHERRNQRNYWLKRTI